MPSIKGHFDGTAVVLDEPASLAVGQLVRVIVEGGAGECFEAPFNPLPDPTMSLFNGDAVDELDAIQVDPLDRVPPDFVRKPGSGAGQIKMAADFDATPADFGENL